MPDTFTSTLMVNTTPARIWFVLTNPASVIQWMGDPEMYLEIETTWQVNSPVIIRGYHHARFENKGIVLKYVKEQTLSYTHLSSASSLPDEPHNYTIFEFTLEPTNNQTLMTLTISNFPTEIIRKHLEFYWQTTIMTLKNHAEAPLSV